MSRQGDYRYNAVTESLFATLRVELETVDTSDDPAKRGDRRTFQCEILTPPPIIRRRDEHRLSSVVATKE